MIDIRSSLNATPDTTAKTVVMEMDAQSALYLGTILANVQGESEEATVFCNLLARNLFEVGSKCR